MEYDLTEILSNIKNKDKISISYIQRTFSFGFIKSNKIFNELIKEEYINKEGIVNKKKIDPNYKEGLKLIFLDIDGVLNCSTTKDKCSVYTGIEDEKVSLLKQIVDSTNSKIVLVSSWKYNWYKEANLKKEQDELASYLDLKLNKQGLTIIDKTDDEAINRGEGIKEYIRHLKIRGVNVDKFIILDDEMFDYKETKLTKHLIETSYKDGLLEKHVKKAIEKLLN